MAYSTLSKELTARLEKETKQAQGIYFTPPACVARNLALLAPYLAGGEFREVLEPACGSGEYLTALRAAYPAMRLTGIEYNRTIYEAIRSMGGDMTLLHENYLAYKPQTLMYGSATLYDLIIGNPPYFVMAKTDVPKAYHPYFDGRPNIFILFLLHSLRLLRPGGLLSFILPKNFLNCLYYDKTRAYLNKKCEILVIEECSNEKYLETQQETIIFIVRKRTRTSPSLKTIKLKKKNNKAFILKRQGYTIFAPPASIPILNALYQNSTSLAALGFKVSVGTVVWNQCKAILTTDARETRLIYSSDIVDNKLVLKTYHNQEKKNFIQQAGWTHPLLIVNRGYGVGDYKFNYCLLAGTLLAPYLIENHLIYIDSLTTRADLLDAYEKIIASFNDERTAAFIRAYCGNNALNTTELATILPIYIKA
jgi:hypothetical protein